MAAIETDTFLPHPPAAVWRALTDPALLARWLMPNDFAPRGGHRFTVRAVPAPGVDFDGIVHCEVLDLRPEEFLRISWRGGAGLDTTVTWRLARRDAAVPHPRRLRLDGPRAAPGDGHPRGQMDGPSACTSGRGAA